ncbi:hypothetical protein DICPUDRAFT_51827 [Dictyostelium purpureum]|uniref:Importin N-terminal domain-containing protein n=1 Tax=Dictyostelium purpureum TaxID=5786 RepID=F1A5Q7_DICPU|nr:uncharacterized protein DICPUDRAFT_51827 [Dictyostelium purpureum]EGC28472.1 hypothetical protein DICPUDRAFT_51827 [Dictyostelium purpureum]|eukprot:XP_003295001.1 hypothetical protein DICPUDRAFT_51827 [Dictyostelium purpureum]
MELLQALVGASNPDPNVRQAAENFLTTASNQNFPLFIHSLTSELINEEREPKIRQLAGIVLKNSIYSKSQERNEVLIKQWVSIDAAARNVIKNDLLRGLSSPIYDARHTAAIVISHIGLIEIPHSLWEELIPSLFKNIETGGEHLKQVTLQTIGYICEEIDPDVMSKYSDNVLRVITDGIRDESPNVKLAGIQALCHTLEFIKGNFEKKEQRDYIMKVIIDNSESQNPLIKKTAFENLVKIASIYYDHILEYMNPIFKTTVEAIQKDPTEDVVLQAIEFWTSLAEEEQNQIDIQPLDKLVIPKALDNLIPILLETLTKQSEHQDGGWGITPAGATCIQYISHLMHMTKLNENDPDRVAELVLPFIKNNITSQEWRLREASCTALGSILEDRKNLGDSLIHLIPVILQLIGDTNDMVKETASWTIGQICDHQIFNVSQLLESILKQLIAYTEDKNVKVATHCCWAIHNICQAFEGGSVGPYPTLQPASQEIAKCLIKAAHRTDIEDDDHKLKTNAYEALNSLISYSNASPELIVEILKVTFMDFEQSFKMEVLNQDDCEAQFNLQSLLCSTFQAIASTLKEHIQPYAKDMLNYLFLVFKNQSVIIYEEALLAIDALVLALESEFEQFFPPFLNILINFLQNVEYGSVTNIAIGIVGDLARSFGKKFSGICETIVPLIISDLTNPKLSMNAKPSAISCLCDIAISVGADFIPYLPTVMPILSQASKTELDDEEFLNELRETIFQAYTGILQGLKGDNRVEELNIYLNDMFNFIQVIHSDGDRSDEVTSSALALIGDLAQSMGEQVKAQLNNPLVKELVNDGIQRSVNYADYARDSVFTNNLK